MRDWTCSVIFLFLSQQGLNVQHPKSARKFAAGQVPGLQPALTTLRAVKDSGLSERLGDEIRRRSRWESQRHPPFSIFFSRPSNKESILTNFLGKRGKNDSWLVESDQSDEIAPRHLQADVLASFLFLFSRGHTKMLKLVPVE